MMTSGAAEGPGPYGNVSDLLRVAATRFPDRSALVAVSATYTWAGLESAVDAAAAAMLDSGLQRGDRVIVSLPTGSEIIAALFAVARAGLVAVPIGPDRTGLDDIVRRVGARGAITARPDSGADIVVGQDEMALWWTAPAGPEGRVETVGGGEDLAVLARGASGQRPVMVSHRAILAAVEAILAAPSLGLRAEDRVIQVLPTYHLAGWVTAFLPLCAVGGAAVVPAEPSADLAWIDAVLSTIRSQKVTVVPGAPSLYRRLLPAVGVERALASVRLLTSGAAPLDPGTFSAIRALTGLAVREGYGVSESASVISTGLMTSTARAGSVGLPVPGVQIRIVGDDGVDLYAEGGPESGQPALPTESDGLAADAGAGGEVGRIQISGPTLFSGYWPDGSGGPDADGWFATGDLGYLDDTGQLHLVDREAETVRIAGFTVYPREIEEVLSRHPYVRDAAVIGVPGRAGDVVVAVLVPQRGTHPTATDLDEFVLEKLPVFKRPHRYQLVDRLPRNEIGRIDRDAVRTLYRSEASLQPSGFDDGRERTGRPDTELAAEMMVQVPDRSTGRTTDDEREKAEPITHVTPEPAAPLSELGSRLPGTGHRDRRANEDTDDDLF